MKRNPDLIRKILLEWEEADEWHHISALHSGTTPEEYELRLHVNLLCDAGLAIETGTDVFRITNQGYDFLDAIRNDTIWAKTKEATKGVGGVALSVLKEVAVSYIKQELRTRTGIDIS